MTSENKLDLPADSALSAGDPVPGGVAVAAGPAGQEPAGPPRWQWLTLLSPTRLSALYLWAFFMVLFGILSGSTFLTSTTYTLVFSEGVVVCILALAFLVPLACNEFDLSIGGNMVLSAAINIYLYTHTGLPVGVTAAIGVLACVGMGCVTGFVVVRLRVSSFIATLGMSQVLLAAALLISGNQQMIGEFPESWTTLGRGTILGVPTVIFILLGLSLVLWYIFEFTRIGRYLFAIGGNAEAARLSGVRTDRFRTLSLVASGGLAGFAGVVYTMRTGVLTASIGPSYLFPAAAAVFLGASQFSRRPNVWGTLIAYFALAFGIQGLLLTVSSSAVWVRPAFEGVSLIVVVAVASQQAAVRLKTKRDRSESAA